MIVIEKRIESTCSYKVNFTFSPRSNSAIGAKGEMTIRGNSVWFQLYDPPTMEFKFFDFDLDSNQFINSEIRYQSGSPLETEKTIIKVLLENAIQVTDDLIYVFRAKEAFYYEDLPLDVVYFVSKNRGVIGTYLSTFYEGKENYFYPRGDVLYDYVDYSVKERRKLL